MSDKHPIEALLNTLFSGAQLIRIDLREGQSPEEAIAEYEVAHRAECPSCAAEYEAEQNEAEQNELAKDKAAFDAIQRGAGIATPDDLVHAAIEEARREFETKAKEQAAPKERKPIGFMVFIMKDGEMTPVRGSFETDFEVITKKLASFSALPQIKMMADLATMFGSSLMEAQEIRPVYGD
jgi:hypothetical protein